MEPTFATVVVVVVVISVILAVVALHSIGDAYSEIGKGAFALDLENPAMAPPPGSAAARVEAEAEIRQMLEAKSRRQVARGEPPLDIDAEVASLLIPAQAPTPGQDDELRDEIRVLVEMRNRRRQRAGEEPLDVGQEIDRQLRELGA